MTQLHNPFTAMHNYRCFGCSPDNDHGLHLGFTVSGNEVHCAWDIPPHFEGWPGVLHGGIAASLIDQAGGWYVFAVIGVACMTVNLNINYLKPVMSLCGPVRVVASLIGQKRRLCTIGVKLYNNSGELAVEAEARYYCFSPEESADKFQFPGKDAFYSE